VGELLAVLSLFLFSAANVSIGKSFRGRSSGGGSFLSMLMTFGLALSVWAVLGWRSGSAMPSYAAIAWFALAGLLTALLGRLFLYTSIRHLGAVKGAAVKRLNPMFSVLLGVMLLGETMSLPMAFGMALIAASFVVLIRESLHSVRDSGAAGFPDSAVGRTINLGYLQGSISALAYALGYVARKQGLLIEPDPFLGTLVGALAGVAMFVGLAPAIASFRTELRTTFTELNSWLWLAGLFTSVGQLSYFAALKYSTISKIALITSMEVFVTIFLTRVVLRTDTGLTRPLALAALLGVLGTALVIRY
jgi:drug/metabolite transporter (DMT)-like permease